MTHAPKLDKEKNFIDKNEFMEERGESLKERNIACDNLGNPSGDFYQYDNRELEEENQPNNEIGERQLGNPQYKLSLRNGKYSRERSREIKAQEMPRRDKKARKMKRIPITATLRSK